MTSHDPVLREWLERHRSEVLDRWRSLVYESYPEEAARFFRKEKDRFKNPVGRSVHRATATLLDGVLLGRGAEGVPEALEAIVRIRAVQDFSPSEAVAFVFLLKRAVREELEAAAAEPLPRTALADLETRVDSLALSAFETYTHCREQVYEIRVRASQRRIAARFERLGGGRTADEDATASGEAARRSKGVEP
jgi:hypothetical protein